MKHKTRSLIIKRADVDVGILPLVQWINRYDDVFTQFSCQGEFKDGRAVPYHEPMVMFFCMSDMVLMKITNVVTAAGGRVEVNIYHGCTRYIAKFDNQVQFIRMIDGMRNRKSCGTGSKR